MTTKDSGQKRLSSIKIKKNDSHQTKKRTPHFPKKAQKVYWGFDKRDGEKKWML